MRLRRKASPLRRVKQRRDQWNRDKANMPKWVIYEVLPSWEVDYAATTTMETRRQADQLFERIKPFLEGYKQADKRAAVECILHAAKRAVQSNGCLRIDRNRNHRNTSEIRLQVIDAMVKAGLVHECRSKKGSPKKTRLLLLIEMEELIERDPWEHDPYEEKQLVFLRKRDDKTDIDFDPNHSIPSETQKRLEEINEVNRRWEITYEPFTPWSDDEARRQLRPVHYAIFTEDFTKHGRFYTSKYGHHSLRKVERRTIHFNGEPSVELDYGGMHPRMLYHLEGIPFDIDPYALLEGGELRRLVKLVVNAALNAKSPKDVISACNLRTSIKDKSPKKRQEARRLKKLLDESGMTFKEIYECAKSFHAPIAHYFGSDAGMRLMRLDGLIALDILTHFTRKGIPCLSVHDSFLVPYTYAHELEQKMIEFYTARLGHKPIVKPG